MPLRDNIRQMGRLRVLAWITADTAALILGLAYFGPSIIPDLGNLAPVVYAAFALAGADGLLSTFTGNHFIPDTITND